VTASKEESGVAQPSEELRSVTLRYLAAIDRGDVDAIVARHSQMVGLAVFGTGGRPIRGPERHTRYTLAEFEAVGRFPIPDPEVEAWVRGDVGWSFASAKIGERERDLLRISLVFQLEHGDWKIVHSHYSVGEAQDSDAWTTMDRETLELLDKIFYEELPDLSGTVAPDGTVTLVFTDIEGSTALNASFGDKAWLDVLHAHNRVVTSVTLEHGGTVVKGVGDGFLLAFTSARTALAASRAIQDRIAETFNDPGSPIRVRIGIHTGEATREADDFFGHAVNYAARVAGAATGGEVLVSSLTHDLVMATGEYGFDTPREAELKGIEGPQLLYPLARP
jgi:class 3 adenylate cyclase